MDSFPFNELPIELQREIFVVAAKRNQGSALQLVLVAKRVRSWVQPTIYEIVALGSNDTHLFLRTINSLPAEFFTIHVKKLCLSVSVSARNAVKVLSICKGVTDLAFWVDYLGVQGFRTGTITSLISSLPLRRLSIELEHFLSLFPDPNIHHVWDDSITHLDLIFWTRQTAPVIPPLAKLSNLTHLALRLSHNQPTEASLRAILSACRRLKVLVIFDDPETSDETAWSADPRVVYMPYPQNIVGEWEAQARDDLNGWSRAEDLVRRHTAESESLYFRYADDIHRNTDHQGLLTGSTTTSTASTE